MCTSLLKKSVSGKKWRGHQTSKIVKSTQNCSDGPLPYNCSFCCLARAFNAWRQSRSQSFVPLDQRSENESCGSIHFQITMEITEFCISGFTAHARAVRSLHVWSLWRMPEMDAPRALVFRPLVKGNEALGTRLCMTCEFACAVTMHSSNWRKRL